MEDVHHNALELLVHFLKGPAETLGVLAHFQSGGGYAACVGGLAGAEEDAAVLEILGGIQGSGHIGTLGHCEAAVCHQHLGVVQQKLILGSAGKRHIALDAPDALAFVVLGVGPGFCILGEPGTAHLLDFNQGGNVDAVRVVDPARGVGAGHRLCAQLPGFLNGIGCHVAGAGDGDGQTFQALSVAAEHFIGEIQQTVSRGLGPGQGTAVAQALAGEHAFVEAGNALILTVQVADFPGAYANVSGGDVHVGADVAVELRHEALAEGHDLPVGLALGVKVGAALAAADGQACQAVFEHLLKAQEFNHAEVYRGVQTQAAFVGADGAVKLDPISGVDVGIALVVHPGHPEKDGPLRAGQTLQKGVLAIFCLVLFNDHPQGFQDLGNGLLEFGLIRILGFHPRQGFIYITHEQLSSLERFSWDIVAEQAADCKGNLQFFWKEIAKIEKTLIFTTSVFYGNGFLCNLSSHPRQNFLLEHL